MSRLHHYFLATLLVSIALTLFVYKARVLKFPLHPPHRAHVWDVEAEVRFNAKQKSAKIALLIPRTTESVAIDDERFISQGLSLSTSVFEGGNRQVVWSSRKLRGADRTLYYHAVVRRVDQPYPPPSLQEPELPKVTLSGAAHTAAQNVLHQIDADSNDFASFVIALLKRLDRNQPDASLAVLIGKDTPNSVKRRAEVAVQLLAMHGTPARVIHGLRLAQGKRHNKPLHWLEVFSQGSWIDFDVLSAQLIEPGSRLIWWRGDDPIVIGQGVDHLQARLSITPSVDRDIVRGISTASGEMPFLLDYSLLRLPLSAQAVLRVTLLIPIGAFLVVLLRTVIGFKTFGTFMPVLVALAFRETHLAEGLLLFVLVVGLGLLCRFYFEQLKLLLVPRLAAVLTVVVLVMAAIAVLSHKLGFEFGLSVALFPMVVMTMTIERMSIVWDERGPTEAALQAIGSLAAASMIHAVFSLALLEHLILVFPELLLLVLAASIVLGRYTGYRLLELRRFSEITRERMT